jgi:hypothetical protein
LTSQWLDRRIADLETMQKEIQAWAKERNTKQKGVDWRFTLSVLGSLTLVHADILRQE